MAILVQNGRKCYQNSLPILDNLNLVVEPGTIFGLLGSSGCGKTTLLSCIVGLKQLDSGDLLVLGCKPVLGSGLGYMPQEIALYPTLNIRETLWFYGTIYNMKQSEIIERAEFLSSFLELPDLSKLIMNLSGGQLRRVSFAVALIHKPKLLILDEPTVGLDPLLRESIWNHLRELVKIEKTTILITTHYQEESKFCHKIGVMRRGQLLFDQNPCDLLIQQKTDSLSTAILQLCKKDEEIARNDPERKSSHNKNLETFRVITDTENHNHYNHKNYSSFEVEKSQNIWLRKELSVIFAIIYKSFILYVRKPQFMIARIIFPILHVTLLSNVVGLEPAGAKIAFVTNDLNFNEPIKYCEKAMNKTTLTCFNHRLSSVCSFFMQFKDQEINWIPAKNVEEALSKVENGQVSGYLRIPTNFTFNLRDRLLMKQFSDNDLINASTISLKMDKTSVLLYVYVNEKVVNKYTEMIVNTVESCGGDKRAAQIPLKLNSIYGDTSEENTWAQFMQPHLIIMLTFMLSNTVCLFLIIDKKMGIEDRGAVAGINFFQILTSSIILESIYTFIYIAEVFLVLTQFYGMEVKGSWVLAVALVYLVSISGVAIGLILWTICSHEMDVIMAMTVINSIHIMSTGGMWPLEGVPYLFKPFCYFLPITVPITALRSILYKGWGLMHPIVGFGFIVSLLWILFSLLVSYILHKRKIRTF